MNWRKPVIHSFLYITGSQIPKCLKYMCEYERASKADLDNIVEKKLRILLYNAWSNVPYYRRILQDCSVVIDGKVDFSRFTEIPVLTRQIIKTKGDTLHNNRKKRRGVFVNHSGGSSGEPVTFLQDRLYSAWNVANTMYYKTFAGQKTGDVELRLWGSQRDLLEGTESTTIRLRNWLYNRKELNAFIMTPEKMTKYVEQINSCRPGWIEAYAQPMAELARFIKQNNMKVYFPRGVLTSAGTLYPQMRQLIEDVFDCKVYNRYGSREAGGIACSCGKQAGLHVSVWNTFVEILDNKFKPVPPGQIGKVYVTTLNNHTMPLIRYDIGDMAVWQDKPCQCGRTTPILANVVGRSTEVFRTRDGRIIPAELFIHFIGVVFNAGYINKFQVIQRDYQKILIRVVVNNQEQFQSFKERIVSLVQNVMGINCLVEFESVGDIKPLANGKFLYTICEVS
jgi:phenylacetate-CoA ligase